MIIKHNKNMNKFKEIIFLVVLVMMMIIVCKIDIVWGKKVIESKRISLDYDEYIKSNLNDLEKINGLLESNDNLIVSKIKYRDIYNFKREITIYKGSKDKIRVGNVVLNNEGMVGVVFKVYDDVSVVKLIGGDLNVSVQVNDAYGVLTVDNGDLVVRNVSNYDAVNVGDLVYTSGIGNLRGGIYIGRVVRVDLVNGGIEKVIKLELGCNIDKLDYVVVWLDD